MRKRFIAQERFDLLVRAIIHEQEKSARVRKMSTTTILDIVMLIDAHKFGKIFADAGAHRGGMTTYLEITRNRLHFISYAEVNSHEAQESHRRRRKLHRIR